MRMSADRTGTRICGLDGRADHPDARRISSRRRRLIWATKPDVIVETGVARGGSVDFLGRDVRLIGKGKVIGVDIDIRAHNRDTIEKPSDGRPITLIEGRPSTRRLSRG